MALVQLPYASYVASLPLIQEDWGLGNAQAGIIYSAYLAGFALAALLISPLTDRYPSTAVFLACVWGSVIGNLLFPLWAVDFVTGSLLRFVAGPWLAGVYVPGIRIVSDHFAEKKRGMAVGLFVSAFYLGNSASLALMGILLPYFGWRTCYLIAGLLASSGIVLAHVLLRYGPSGSAGPAGGSGWLSLTPLRSKPLLLIIAGYALHAWELYIVRVWLPPFLAAVLIARGMEVTKAAALGAGLSALMLGMGVPGPFLGGLLSDRMGRTGAAILLLGVSGMISFTIGWMVHAPWGILVAVGLIYGFAVAADSAIYSTGLTELADQRVLGSSQAFHTFFAFGAGVVSPITAGAVLDLSPAEFSWGMGFSTAGVAALLGVGALLWLRRLPESTRMAYSKR